MTMPPFAPLFALLVALFLVFFWYQFKVELCSKRSDVGHNIFDRVSFGSLEQPFELLLRHFYLWNLGMLCSYTLL